MLRDLVKFRHPVNDSKAPVLPLEPLADSCLADCSRPSL